MVTPHVRLDPSSSLGSVENLREPLEDQLTSALQNAVEKVDDEYAGETVDEVSDKLLESTKDGLHEDIAESFVPDDEQLRSVAESIVDGQT